MRIAAVHQFTRKNILNDKSERQHIENRYSPNVPIADGGENRERPFAKNEESGKRPFVMRWCYVCLNIGSAAVAAVGFRNAWGRNEPKADRGLVTLLSQQPAKIHM